MIMTVTMIVIIVIVFMLSSIVVILIVILISQLRIPGLYRDRMEGLGLLLAGLGRI